MNSETGKRFGPYEILGELGGGGMGVVYRAFDSRLHREVALKVLRQQYDSPGMRERFLREARAVSALNHPNICTIFDIGEQDNDPYLVMEMLQGETVRERIERGPMTTAEIVDAGIHIADALAEAHSKGIIHRDIKPANIFLVRKAGGAPQVKVLDFGLAKIQHLGDSFESENLTGTGATVGTVAYMSPEQARGDNLDARSDLFSFGSLLYEMATGQLPFTGATSAMVFVALLSKDPDPVRDWNPAIPRELERVILKALTKESRHRYRNAGEMRDALRAITAKVPVQGRFFKPKSPSPPNESESVLPTFGDPVAREKRLARPGEGPRVKPPNQQPVWQEGRSSGESQSHYDARPPEGRFAGPSPSNAFPAASPSGASAAMSATQSSPSGSAAPTTPISGASGAQLPQRDAGQIAKPASGAAHASQTQKPLGTSGAIAVAASSDSVAGPGFGSEYSDANASSASMDSDVDSESHSTVGSGERISTRSVAYARPVPPARRARRRHYILYGAAVAMVAIAAAGAYFLLMPRLHAPLLASGDYLLVAALENKTNDPMLEGTIREAVLLQLRQSPTLNLLSDESIANDQRVLRNPVAPPGSGAARQLAQQEGIKAFVAGSVSGSGPYSVDLEAIDAQTGAVLGKTTASSPDRNQLLDAAGKAAADMRVRLGEAPEAVNGQHVPLTQATTSSLEAFHDFALGESAVANGDMRAAIEQYQLAVALDPKFALACAQLARANADVLDMEQAAGRSQQANDLGAALSDRDRMYLDAEFNILGNHDLMKAAEEVEARAKQFPNDSAAAGVLAAIYNLLGRFADSHTQAVASTTANPSEAEGYLLDQIALIGLDRYEAASRVQADAARYGVSISGFAATIAFLAGNQALFAKEVAHAGDATASYAVRGNYALILDDTGQFDAASYQWQALARDAESAKLNGSAGYVLAQAAMDRALAGECGGTLALAGQAATLARDSHSQFRVAMAAALCGNPAVAQGILDDFGKSNPKGTLVSGFYVPDIEGAIALKAGDPQRALDVLNAARTYDLISPTPYLRGLAHLASGQAQLALGDFQLVLAHRGAALVSGNITYSLAQVGVGQAYAAIGDRLNSADAYRKFLADWQQADVTLPLMIEARKNSQ